MSWIILKRIDTEYRSREDGGVNEIEKTLYIVGHYNPAGIFIEYKNYSDRDDAELKCSYLNGSGY